MEVVSFVLGLQLLMCAMGTAMRKVPPYGDKSGAIARELALSLRLHEQSIRTLEWVQTTRLDLGTPDETLHRNELVFDERGRWFDAYDHEGLPDEGTERSRSRGCTLYDGRTVSTFREGTGSGSIDEDTGRRKGGLSIDAWLGHDYDGAGDKRLSDRLLEATDLHVEKFSPRGLPVLTATTIIRDLMALLEVEVDPDHGFAPRSITIRDRAIRLPYYRYEITAFVLVDGVWLPERALFEGRMFQPTPDEAGRLGDALRPRGLSRASNMKDPNVQAGYLAALKEAFGSDEAPSKVFIRLREVVASYRSINKPIPDARFVLEFPSDYAVYDAIQNLIRYPNTSTWVESRR